MATGPKQRRACAAWPRNVVWSGWAARSGVAIRLASRADHRQCAARHEIGRRLAMAISLYDVSVTSFLQVLGGVSGFLERGLAHCQDNGVDPESIVETRLFEDMLPFRFQIISVAPHS